MKDAFEKYLLLLRQDRGDKTEHSDRGALENLLNKAAEAAGPGIRIIHKAKKVRGSGAPDFKIMKAAMILGYVENKTIDENLDQVLKSEQIARYMKLSNNILLTDYLEFIWIKDAKVNGREVIAFPDDLEGKPQRPREDRVKAVSDLLRGFFSIAPEGIGRAQQLALALATRSQFLRDFLDLELRRQEKEHREARLYGLFQVFRDQVFHELTLDEFADAFAQMLAYGLFLAKLNSEGNEITLDNARQFVPGSFRLIRELVQFLDDLAVPDYAEIRWVVEEILSIVNGLDLRAIHEDLSFKHRKAISRKVRAQDEEEHRLFERDPFIYFYEDFLGKYDAKMKKARGVYYTPPPIVNFIVHAVDDILKERFGISDGLADHKRVTVLDFACGTGTFILEVFERIFENIGGADSGKASLIVRDHMLKNIFGFEYLIAPYTIAHLKLSQYLADKGHALQDGERLQVFLTNTLEPMEPQRNFLLPALSEETAKAQEVKEKKILVITGNPPYSGHSKNKGMWISTAIDKYKFVYEADAEGHEHKKPLGERNPKWLNDDYVKFIRFAQMKMDAVDAGVVGIITNHSWLDNPTFRGMRQSLMRSFDQIYVLDLHGNTKKKERSPDGLLVPRQIAIAEWQHVLVAENVAESCAVSNKTSEGNYNFPLYCYPPHHRVHRPKSDLSDNIESSPGQGRIENIAPAFRKWLDEKYELHFSPEELFGYIYAVLHALAYRTRYAEFLRIDFPRVPFPDSADDFEALSGLGWALVQAHLLRELPRQKLAVYHGKSGHVVEAVCYSPEQQVVAINKSQSFKPVPQAVWDFHIGGYQVLDKYLKSRKGRALSLDEINHVSAIADSLAFTIAQMARIDEAYRAAFPDRG